MSQYRTEIVKQFESVEPGRGNTSQRPEHLGTPRTWYGLKNAQRRQVLLDWIKDHQDMSYDEWAELIDALYQGVSYEERCAPQTLLVKFPSYRQRVPLHDLSRWLGQLEGWAEVDSTCQSVFTEKEMLADWNIWRDFLERLTKDNNINKRRASLVLLTYPITNSPDERLIQQALKNVDILKHEKDKLITKAISWVLRKGIKQHGIQIASYLNENVDSLPAIAVRETRRKLLTGKK
jgi:3-methyladenine DNA glycosylase AlkD